MTDNDGQTDNDGLSKGTVRGEERTLIVRQGGYCPSPKCPPRLDERTERTVRTVAPP